MGQIYHDGYSHKNWSLNTWRKKKEETKFMWFCKTAPPESASSGNEQSKGESAPLLFYHLQHSLWRGCSYRGSDHTRDHETAQCALYTIHTPFIPEGAIYIFFASFLASPKEQSVVSDNIRIISIYINVFFIVSLNYFGRLCQTFFLWGIASTLPLHWSNTSCSEYNSQSPHL